MAMLDLNQSEFAQLDALRLPLINRFYSKCNYKVSCGRQDRVYSLVLNGEIIAAARLVLQPSQCYLLRNLCVLPALRGCGVASYFVKNIIADLAGWECYCYALPHLKHFYLALGFRELTVAQVPADIAETHLRNQARKRGWLLMGVCPEAISANRRANS